MTKKERKAIVVWADGVSDEDLKNEYYNLVDSVCNGLVDRMYDLGYDMRDISEREKYEKFLSQKCDLLGRLCAERGIELWKNEVD